MKKTFLVLVLLLSGLIGSAHATNYLVAAGANVSTIQAAINAAAGDTSGASSVTFAAGSYTISSQLSIPCPHFTMTIQGPVPTGVGVSWPITPTANLTSTLTNQWAFSGSSCSVGTTFQYFKYNGGNPAGGGGGFLYVPSGMNNLTVQWNVMFGVSAIQTTTQASDSFIWMDGSPTSARTQNATIRWNKFGQTGDCGTSTTGIMNLFGGGTNNCTSSGYNLSGPSGGTSPCLYQGSTNWEPGGGYCAAVGVHVNTDNLTISNNSIGPLEQGMKFFEGGSKAPNIYTPTNLTVNANDIFGTHRIDLEAQQNNGFTVTNNDLHDPGLIGNASWGLSLPQTGPNNINNNVLIRNHGPGVDKNGQSGYWPGQTIEMWGVGTVSNNNLVQGVWQTGINWGFGGSPWMINNNIIQGLTMSQPTNICSTSVPNAYIANEECSPPAPTQSGNVTSSTVSARASVAPTISPAAGAQTFPLTVTLTDPGYTSGAGPQGNTGIWYTTDNSTPIPGSNGTYLLSGGTFSLSAAATVKAVGMWGALNQPTSYPSGYGFVPSSVVSSAFTGGGGTPTAATPTLSPTSGTFSSSQSVTISDTTSGSSIWYTTDGSTPVVSSSPLYTGALTLTATTTVNAVASASGFLTSAMGTGTYTLTTPTLTGGHLDTSPTSGVNTMSVGGPNLQMIAIGTYSDGSSGSFPSPVWASDNTPVCTINSSTGLVTAVASGHCSLQAHNGTLFTSGWGVNVSASLTVPTSGMVCKGGGGPPSGGLPGPGGTPPTQGVACHP